MVTRGYSALRRVYARRKGADSYHLLTSGVLTPALEVVYVYPEVNQSVHLERLSVKRTARHWTFEWAGPTDFNQLNQFLSMSLRSRRQVTNHPNPLRSATGEALVVDRLNAASESTDFAAAGVNLWIYEPVVLLNYVYPVVTIEEPSSPTGLRAAAVARIVDGRVDGVDVTYGGSGYTSAPTVTISPPPLGGVQATATAALTDDAVSGIALARNGSGYTSIDPVPYTFLFGDNVQQLQATDVLCAQLTLSGSGGESVQLPRRYSGDLASYPVRAFILSKRKQFGILFRRFLCSRNPT